MLVTVVFNYENDTCLQAYVLVEKKDFRKTDHFETLIKRMQHILENDLFTTDEYHTD